MNLSRVLIQALLVAILRIRTSFSLLTSSLTSNSVGVSSGVNQRKVPAPFKLDATMSSSQTPSPSSSLVKDTINAILLPPIETSIALCLQTFLSQKEEEEDHSIAALVIKTVEQFHDVESSTAKRAGRMALEETARKLLTASSCPTSNLQSTVLVVTALALNSATSDRTIASAIASVLTKKGNEMQQNNSSDYYKAAYPLIQSFLDKAAGDTTLCDAIDWHIVAGLAKAIQFHCLQNQPLATTVAKLLQRTLPLEEEESPPVNNDLSSDDINGSRNNPIAASLALAAQLQPWQVVKPETLIPIALAYDLWHAAERICDSSTESSPHQSNTAVEALLEGAFQAKLYRQADTYATKFFSQGGNQRYLEARYLHACGTIAKVIRKGAIPVIDKQIERVDRAAETMLQCEPRMDTTTFFVTPENASNEIRRFALEQLDETGNPDAAHRLATLWGIDHAIDEEAILAAQKARREKYLQWEDVLSGPPPDLIANPKELVSAIHDLTRNSNCIGFDCEWGEDDKGADILQLANQTSVVLVDLHSLLKTQEGVDELGQTVGRMFASPNCTKVGFSCRQDLSKLRGSTGPGAQKSYWMKEIKQVVDLQTIVKTCEPTLARFGLSRVCEQYLGKPLDKSEQCSLWNARPLSLRQRTYAALDAWTVVAIYEQLQAGTGTGTSSHQAEEHAVKRMRSET